MPPRKRPLERTRQYDVWAEHRSQKLGPYELVLQVVDDLTQDEGPYMIRAGYRKDGVMRPSQPVFGSKAWVEALVAAVGDPEVFSDDEVELIRAACARRTTGRRQ